MSGKGSSPRPFSVPQEEFDAAFDRIFGKPQKKTPDEPGKGERTVEGEENSPGEIVCQ